MASYNVQMNMLNESGGYDIIYPQTLTNILMNKGGSSAVTCIEGTYVGNFGGTITAGETYKTNIQIKIKTVFLFIWWCTESSSTFEGKNSYWPSKYYSNRDCYQLSSIDGGTRGLISLVKNKNNTAFEGRQYFVNEDDPSLTGYQHYVFSNYFMKITSKAVETNTTTGSLRRPATGVFGCSPWIYNYIAVGYGE